MLRGKVSGPRQAGQRFHTSVALPAHPPLAVVRAGPRAGIDDHSAPSATGNPGRQRAITMIGGDLAPPTLKPSGALDPVLLEMKKGVLLDVGKILEQFSNLNRSIRDFCGTCAEHIGKSKRLPRIGRNTVPPPQGSPVCKPASEFTSAEDYSFFALLSIINNRVYADIFQPFHPAASPEENDQRGREYAMKIDISSQLDAASWRSKTFKAIDIRVTVPQQLNRLQGTISSVIHELMSTLQPLLGPITLPDSFGPQLEDILETAYEWNRNVKMDVRKYNVETFVVAPHSEWESLQMEPFGCSSSSVRAGRKVISSVSLGLTTSAPSGGARVSHVQQKAHVLVEERFHIVSQQPGANAGMSVRPPPPRRPPPPTSNNCAGAGAGVAVLSKMGTPW